MKYFSSFLTLACLLTFVSAQKNEPRTVDSIDLTRYSGRWYELARYPNRFEKGCARNVTADYTLRTDGRIKVVNTCETRDGKAKVANGEAKIADRSTHAKLRVRFAPSILSWLPFVWGEYWILDLDPYYRHAIVGDSRRDYFWILSREPRVNDQLYDELLRKAAAQGFDPKRVERTEQKW